MSSAIEWTARATPRALSPVLATLACALLAAPAPAAPAPVLTILQLYTTAETSSSAEVVWNTDTASDSRVQYSTVQPIPADAPSLYLATPVTVHQFELTGLAPATFYYFRVTSCARRGCASASGIFDTFPVCPNEVPPISGGWQRENSPNFGGSAGADNELLGVAAIAEDEAWAVGWSQDPAAPPYVKRTLIERYAGGAWNLVASPNPAGATSSVLRAVAASAPNDVWAVGAWHDGTLPSRTMIQHWNGAQWSLVPSPSPDTQLNELYGVAALSASNAWAVGFRGGTHSDTPLETLILHWDGASWTQVTSPNVPVGANQLFAMTAISAAELWAVGSAGGTPLAMRWNGAAWSVVAVSRDAGLITEKLTGVSAGGGGKDVWAVGDGRGYFTNQTFATIKHFDGTHWTDKVCRAPSASNPPPDYEGGGPTAYFTAVAAAAVDDVWAVGVRGSGPLVQHQDGDAWTTITHPRAYPHSALLHGIATSIGGKAWAVGVDIEIDPSGQTTTWRTLIHRYSP